MKESTWLGYIDAFIAAGDFAANTVKSYRITLARFVHEIRPHKRGWEGRAIGWKGELAEQMVPRSVSHHITCVRSFLKWCGGMGYAAVNPMMAVKIRVTKSGDRSILSDAEVRKLLAVKLSTGSDICDERVARDRAILMIMLYTGMRVSGVRMLDIEDIKTRNKVTLVYYVGKGHIGKDAFAVLRPQVVEAVDVYLESGGRSRKQDVGPLFIAPNNRISESGMRRAVNGRFAEAGVDRPGITIHSLRHTAATKAYRAGVSTGEIQRMLDHKSPATTELYLHEIKRVDKPPEMSIDYGEDEPDANV